MKRLVLLSMALVTLTGPGLFSQSKEEIRNNFIDAESMILYESFKDALPLYFSLLKTDPKNSNYKYRIGQCYLNIPGEKKKAISYLEDAVKNMNPDYKKSKFGETAAPYDALFFLGNAYQIDNQLDKALETYQKFRKTLNPVVYDTAIVALQIKSCIAAGELMKKPVYVKEQNLGNIINGNYSEFNPVVSDNEDLIVFSRSLPFYDAIFFAVKSKGQWTTPQNMNEILKVDKDLYPTSISKDGKTLYLYSSADYDGTIYTSRFKNGKWLPLVKLNENINTKYWESHATISHDNSKLYFTSNRKGTYGGLDIYVSQREGRGDWGPAVNLGPVINTPYNEESPFLSSDDKTLFFSSRGHLNMGGYDIFYSTLLDNGEWSVPLNIGYPVNTTDDNLFFKPQDKGYVGYIAKEGPGGFGKLDIYRIEIFSDDNPRKFFVKGIVKVSDLMNNLKDSVKISTRSGKKPEHTLIVFSNPATGEYSFQVPQGKYQITYESEGRKNIVKNIEIPLNYSSDIFELPETVLSKSEEVASLYADNNKTLPDNNNKALSDNNKTLSGNKRDSAISHPVAKSKPRLPDKSETGNYGNLTDEEVAALLAKLKSRDSGKLLDLLVSDDIKGQKFAKADDLISYLKKEAMKKNINSEEVEKLALRLALRDNILTQAAVDLLAKYTDGDLKKILSDLDIKKANLKTWTDLQQYISEKTGGSIGPEELNKIAEAILADVDPAISILRDKILAFSKYSEDVIILRKSVAILDQSNIKLKEKWLQSFYNEAVKQGLTLNKMANMLAIISSYPDTQTGQYLSDLIKVSDEPLLSSLKLVDLGKEQIKSSAELIKYLLINKDKEKYPEEAVFKSIANLIISNNITPDLIASQLTTGKGHRYWILWIVAGAGLVFFFLIFRKKKRKVQNK